MMSTGVLYYRNTRYAGINAAGQLLSSAARRLISGIFNHRARKNSQTPAEKLRAIVTEELAVAKAENPAFIHSTLGAAKILGALTEKLEERRAEIAQNSYVNGDQKYSLIEQLISNDIDIIRTCLSSSCHTTCRAMLDGIDQHGSAYDYIRNKNAVTVQKFERS